RIHAVTGMECIALIRKHESTIREIASLLKGPEGEIQSKVRRLIEEMKEMERQLEVLRAKEYQRKAAELISYKKIIGGRNVVSCFLEGYQQDALRGVSDYLRDRMKSGIVVLGGSKDNKAFLLVALTDDLKEVFDARDIIEKGALLIKGRGGGRRDLAQAGGDDISKIHDALAEIEKYIASR
ncbi:MAG: DHHA1 domain-containing protein, partial [Candidatus Aenigmatarchaeota archaeon]